MTAVRDALALGILLLLGIGAVTVAVAAVCGAAAATRAARALVSSRRRRPRRPRPPVVPPELPALRPYVWVECDTPKCGHLQTPHYPAGPNYVACSNCAARRPAPAP
ncbi:hypothetical protein HHL19_36265 [Streptomyces sp. R302]|uniref:hypothetical protein n=1 Tax=unclassified Streptomyces TaxID=2593676 RepID=UPI00145CF364|nr:MULTISPECIES: hypothetical protein [unclassified Streptomyces]NML55692.1 hypothetical protein [Streptomyces sp. R301]NML83966.1 hypothetical protein [Streptomyces sp. R302]